MNRDKRVRWNNALVNLLSGQLGTSDEALKRHVRYLAGVVGFELPRGREWSER